MRHSDQIGIFCVQLRNRGELPYFTNSAALKLVRDGSAHDVIAKSTLKIDPDLGKPTNSNRDFRCPGKAAQSGKRRQPLQKFGLTGRGYLTVTNVHWKGDAQLYSQDCMVADNTS